MFPVVSHVSNFINILHTSKVCEGNCDDAFLKLPNIQNGELRDNSSKLSFLHTFNCICKVNRA